ncbi:metallophosphoesterase [Methanolobus psychrotolerans]|uniref:metallophosphoesterase n=1 Tax=Methanolobus psychrotolerans TaxID=1874706 RepID=UPI000B917BD5|nr:metallophosphoesterase [Methanolobus psychrotolerans]
MDKKELARLSTEVFPLFEAEPAVVRVDHDPVIIVGDLHGNLEALEFILETGASLDCSAFVFLGDYVDRGKHSIEVLCRLFKLKVDRPGNIVLLRGNHETAEINEVYGFYEDLGRDDEVFSQVNETFDRMPIAAVVNHSMFCVHGGIGEPISLDMITKDDRFDYLWNDPCEDNGLRSSFQRWGTREFGSDICEEFLRMNNLERIVRAHSALDDGYRWWFGGKLLSIFSVPEYLGPESRGAFGLLKNGLLEIFVFGRERKGSYSIMGSEKSSLSGVLCSGP